jgi:hypothetical protein
MNKMMGLSPLISAATKTPRKPDTKSGKMKCVIRYVSNQDPNRKAKLGTSKPGTPR